MERKQGFFSALKQEVVRGLSPVKSRSKPRSRSQSPARSLSPAVDLLHPHRSKAQLRKDSLSSLPDSFFARSCSLRPVGETLPPVMEGPDPHAARYFAYDSRKEGWSRWVLGQLSRAPSISSDAAEADDAGSSGIRLLLGVMGAPLAPAYVSSIHAFPDLSIKGTPIESSSAQYILQQYTAATGGIKIQSSIRNFYASGKLKMAVSDYDTMTKLTRNRGAPVETGGFVLWQMVPHMWYVELAVGGSKVRAGSNGKLVWRHTPWLGAHNAKGPVRPLRRALQGLDPLTTASMFANALCIGEKKVNGEDCFILKLSTDSQTLKARSEGTGEIIRHVLFGYFSQKTGLLIYMEDSHLTRIQSNTGTDSVYWETTINSFINDYRAVEGVMIAHSGRSVVSLFRFGEAAMSHSKTRMEESWTIEEVAFNVPGLSMDCFIPPADIVLCGSVTSDPKR
ncbi:uncharacterized protein LOC110037219 [Phalaenopsis equestris]|uniref:uncharacterized protein LOC110037219 n=1 Tax=Phalaenopsis equestris TaxID=78828 RepID=UPI0009E475EF|nr:uncharacterized protein LOC110037219 [Phalaenopsis equestris]